MTKQTKKNTNAKAATKKAATKPVTMESHGPNAKYPFGIKLTDEKGAVSFERFTASKERDKRMAALAGTAGTMKAVNFTADKDSLGEAIPETAKVADAPAKPASAKSTRADVKAAKAAKPKKERQPKDDAIRVRLYAKGEFYFGKVAAQRIGTLPFVAVTVKGKTVTLQPTKTEKDNVPVMRCHAAPVLRVAKLLADSGWTKETQDLVAQPVGDTGLRLEVR